RAAGGRTRRSGDVRLMAFDPRGRVVARRALRRTAVILRRSGRARLDETRLGGTSHRRMLRADRLLISAALLEASLPVLGLWRDPLSRAVSWRFGHRSRSFGRRYVARRRLGETGRRRLDFPGTRERIRGCNMARCAGLRRETLGARLGAVLRLNLANFS